MQSSLRLVVGGAMGPFPFAGQTWLYLNWIRGLQRLGHDVYYVEDHNTWHFDPEKQLITDDCSYTARHIQESMERIDMTDRWALRFQPTNSHWGMDEKELRELYRSCDALLNLGGMLIVEGEPVNETRFRVLIETDPVTDQLRLASGSEDVRRHFDQHDVIATYGENYGADDCGVPISGENYVKTRQPIDLDLWPASYEPASTTFTTIGNYRVETNKEVTYRGRLYRWSKHSEWEKFLSLPRLTGHPFEMATVFRRQDDRERVLANGWGIVPASPMSLDVFGAYPQYIRKSRAEFSVAKEQNILLRSGWFSERDACYLASGKPVIAQQTGFSNILPTGEGLLPFETVDDAVNAVASVNNDYERHCKAARAIAGEFFEAGAVAGRLLSDVGLA